jgi:hypothetical protein
MSKEDKKKAPITDFVAKRPDRYRVAAGKSVATLRGIKAEKDPIEAGDLSGGDADLERLVERGYVEKYK